MLVDMEHDFCTSSAAHGLDVYPLHIWFSFESDKVIKCPVTLTNKTDDLIGVWIAPTSLDVCSYPSYPYVWEQSEYIVDDHKSSLFIRLGPHSSETVYMSMRNQEQPPLEAADEGMFEVVMVATKSKEDLKRLDRHWNHGTWSSEDPLRGANEDLGTVVHRATLRAAVTRDPARCKEVAAHQFIQGGGYINCMDVHPTKTWLLVGYLEGHVSIWNCETQERIIRFQVTDLQEWEICSIKFIAGEQWFAAGDDHGCVHVYAYTSPAGKNMITTLQAYVDKRVTYLAIQPKHTLLLIASWDDKSIKLWDWSQSWPCARVIDTHAPVPGLVVGPRDTSIFASASCGNVIKVWDIHSQDAIATVEGFKPTFYTDSNRDFLATLLGFDGHTIVKIWDLETKKHIHTLCPGMQSRELLCDLASHPTLPILAGIMDRFRSKVHQIVLWDVRTYRVMKRVEVLMKGGFPKILFDGSKDIISLVVATTREISIIKINVPTLLTGCATVI